MATQTVSTKDKMTTYFKGVRAEIKKVIWPNKKELINYTGIVILISVLIALIVYVLDLVINGALRLII